MAGSWRIARIAGIPIYVHWTFLILIGWVAYGNLSAGKSAAETAEGIGFVLALFGCVVLHELGHALAARRFGVPTADITLLPIGGVARLQRIPEHPGQELIVALAGPAVNMVIVAALWAAGVRLPSNPGDYEHLIRGRFLPNLMEVNLFLFLFNLLPAFPMDGGRVLRALLALALEYSRATRIAAGVGQFMAMLFGFAGLAGGSPMLVLIALFVWIGAEAEARQVEERIALKGIAVGEAMMTDFRTLAPEDTLGQAVDLLLAGAQHDFPVVSEGRTVGILTRDRLLGGLAEGGRGARVADVMRPGLAAIDARAPLGPAVAQLREGDAPCLQVVQDGRPVGLLTLENIGEYLLVRNALAARRAPGWDGDSQQNAHI